MVVAVLLGCTYEEKDLRCPLGKSSNELVVVVCQNIELFKFRFLQLTANVVAVLLGCTYEEKDLRCPLGKSSNELVVVVCQIIKLFQIPVFTINCKCSCCTLGLHL